MDASFFRFLALELGPRLSGQRIGKVQSPAEGTWTIEVQGPDRHLLFRPAKPAGLLFLSGIKPENPASPSAGVMWVRKHLSGRRLLAHRADWPSLRLAWELSPGEGRFLVLDLRQGLSLARDLDPDFGREPVWPSLDEILAREDIWREHPHLSPPLRRRLRSLDRAAAQSLLDSLAAGRADGFFLVERDGVPAGVYPWPEEAPGLHVRRLDTALEAASVLGRAVLFPEVVRAVQSGDRAEAGREVRRLRRALARLDEEEARLDRLAACRFQGEALQAALYRLGREAGIASLVLSHPEKGDLDIALDPRLTPAENMAALFARAAKAERGRPHLARRRAELTARLSVLEAGTYEAAPVSRPGHPAPGPCAHPGQGAGPASGPAALTVIPKKLQGLAVSVFRSSHGFLLLRGKNKAANHKLFTAVASPFDLWFHAEGGPGAHVILRLDHPGREVPEATLVEAAQLAALKSWRRGEAQAEVTCARVRDVRAVKGADMGLAAVREVYRTLRVAVDPAVEERLAVAAG